MELKKEYFSFDSIVCILIENPLGRMFVQIIVER